jgi:hypothetical protein
MILNKYYVLVDTRQKLVIDKIQKLPENWKNIAGLPGLTDEQISDLKWAGYEDYGWIRLNSPSLNGYQSSPENLELNKNTFKKLISNFKKQKILDGIEYQGIKFTADEKTRYSLFIKKLSNQDTVNYKSFNKYYTLTKEQIIEICDIIELYVQKCFDWEMKVSIQIENCNTLTDFLNVNL